MEQIDGAAMDAIAQSKYTLCTSCAHENTMETHDKIHFIFYENILIFSHELCRKPYDLI